MDTAHLEKLVKQLTSIDIDNEAIKAITAPEQTALDEAPLVDTIKNRNQKQLEKWL